jgi:hypothetical protein
VTHSQKESLKLETILQAQTKVLGSVLAKTGDIMCEVSKVPQGFGITELQDLIKVLTPRSQVSSQCDFSFSNAVKIGETHEKIVAWLALEGKLSQVAENEEEREKVMKKVSKANFFLLISERDANLSANSKTMSCFRRWPTSRRSS